MRILVAEDQKDMNRLISKRLAAENYSVDSCYNGQEVLDYLECAEYDAIILDIMMPVMNGLQVLKKLRQRQNHIPVLLLTARGSVEDRGNSRNAEETGGGENYSDPGGRSGSAFGYPAGVPPGKGNPAVGKGVFPVALYGAE